VIFSSECTSKAVCLPGFVRGGQRSHSLLAGSEHVTGMGRYRGNRGKKREEEEGTEEEVGKGGGWNEGK